MRPYQAVVVLVAALLLLEAAPIEAKRRKHKGSDHHHHDKSDSQKTKTKTKWSSSTDLASNTQVSTEEHGYYVKRTYAPQADAQSSRRMSPPFLAIPIAWFSCEQGQKDCQATNSAAINSAAQSLNEGYLCDDDCVDLYEPVCGRTANEVAVFYNKCKLNVAKCRSHGLWSELAYAECQQTYPKETACADKKFRSSPYFRDSATVEKLNQEKEQQQQQEKEQEQEDKKKQEKDSSESSEEKEDKKPLALPLPQKPVEDVASIPAPVPVKTPEEIALPPMPMKDTQSPKPLVIAMTEQTPPKVDNDRLKYTVAQN
ncbi:protein FAM170B [Drosophila madeirensis]|uniref:Protein FAM170B n=1 Tax=Drosophila madeirensis TaxID=30013 RepID=A0AAU9FM43_DROMD